MDWLAMQVNFASPGMSWGLAAVVLPIAAHLWLRRLSPAVRWPSVRLLLAAQARRTTSKRWRDVLLMLLRCAAVALVALAFAQPMLGRAAGKQPPPLPGGSGQRVVLVLDGSASMQRSGRDGISLFDRAKADLQARRDALHREGVKVIVVLAGQQPRLVDERSVATLSAGDTWTDLREAVRYAQQFAGDSRVELFSDMQASSWKQAADQTSQPLVVHRYGDDDANVSLDEVGVEPGPLGAMSASEQVTLRYRVVNQSDSERQVTVRYAGDVKLEPSVVTLAARGATLVRVSVGRLGEQPMRVEAKLASSDGLAIDNAVTWLIVPGEGIRVRVGDLGNATKDVKRAIGGDGSGFVVTGNDAQLAVSTSEESLGLSGVVFMNGEAAGAAQITLNEVDQQPWRVFGVSGVEQLQTRKIARTDTELSGGPGVRVLATWSDEGRAAVVFDTQRRVVMTNMDLDVTRSDWTDSPLFLPMLQEWLKLAMGGREQQQAVYAGQAADWQVRGNVPGDARLMGPGGDEVGVVLRRGAGGTAHIEARTDRVGVYRLTDAAGKTLGAWWVGLDARESDLRQAGVKESVPNNASGTEPGVVLEDSLYPGLGGNRNGKPLWPVLVAVAMGLLIVEAGWVGWMRHDARKEEVL